MSDETMADRVHFTKMNGLGNEILVVDMRGRGDAVTPAAAVALAADPATAFDQIMAVHDPRRSGTDAYLDILNADGSKAEACGNGTRCVVRRLAAETGRNTYQLETVAGVLHTRTHDNGMIDVDMGAPEFDWDRIPLAQPVEDTRAVDLQIGPVDAPVLRAPSVVSMGNPHAIFWVEKDVWSYPLETYGPLLETHPLFPERANISIARIRPDGQIDLRTWERGAGLTRACGSAACAAAVAATRLGRAARKVTVHVPGGALGIDWRETDGHVIMTGPTEEAFSGFMDPASGAWTADAPAARTRQR